MDYHDSGWSCPKWMFFMSLINPAFYYKRRYLYLNHRGCFFIVSQREQIIFVHLEGCRFLFFLYALSIHTKNPQAETMAEYAINQYKSALFKKEVSVLLGIIVRPSISTIKNSRIAFVLNLMSNGGGTWSLAVLPSLLSLCLALSILLFFCFFFKDGTTRKLNMRLEGFFFYINSEQRFWGKNFIIDYICFSSKITMRFH